MVESGCAPDASLVGKRRGAHCARTGEIHGIREREADRGRSPAADRSRTTTQQKRNRCELGLVPERDPAQTQSLARAFIREKNHWERLRERNWAEYNIHQAVATCENLITFCEGVLLDLAKTMESIHPRQDQLAGKTESVMLLLDQNGASLSTSDRIDVRSLVGMARETPDYEFANRLLDYAETMAMNRANPRLAMRSRT